MARLDGLHLAADRLGKGLLSPPECVLCVCVCVWDAATASGALLEHHTDTHVMPLMADTTMSVPTMVRINGPLVNEMVQTYNPRPRHNSSQAWVQQSLRLYSDPAPATSPDALDVRTYVDVGIIAGMTLPNRELITRFSTSLDNSVPPDTDSSSATPTPSQQQPKQPGSATVSPSVAAAVSAAAAQQQARQQEQEQRRVNLAARSLSANDDFPDARFVFYTDANGVGIKRREKNHPYFEKYIEK